nr:PH domain-containing protein [Candidatus Freyarchaeota archaeon]
MVYVDKPKPSNGYVSFLILAALFLPAVLLMLIMLISTNITYTIWGLDLRPLFAILFYSPIFFFVIGRAIHAAYNTEYRIENGKLWIKYGYRNQSVSLDEIKGIEKVEFIIGPSYVYCNRFKNGIRIITEKRRMYVSPGDSERFVSELGLKTSK